MRGVSETTAAPRGAGAESRQAHWPLRDPSSHQQAPMVRELPAGVGVRSRSFSLVGLFAVIIDILLFSVSHSIAQASPDLCSLRCPRTHDPTASASQTLRLQACATRPGFGMS